MASEHGNGSADLRVERRFVGMAKGGNVRIERGAWGCWRPAET